MEEIWQVSVKELAEFVWRRGDVQGEGGGPSAEEGRTGHQMLQQSRGDGYRAEIPLRTTVCEDGVTLHISGRADGVHPSAAVPILEEIKTTWQSPLFIRGDNPVHWAQAKLYGHIYLHDHEVSQLVVRLTYLNLETMVTRSFEKSLFRQELELFFKDTVSRYMGWIRRVGEWREQRDQSIRSMRLPFRSYRPGQEALAARVLETLASNNSVFAEAPTGSGKTVAVLLGALRALGKGQVSQVLYLTSKTIGRKSAEETVAELRKNGLLLKSLSLSSRASLCPTGGLTCTGESCALARGHFDRLPNARDDVFGSGCTLREVAAVASLHDICPYWLSRDLVKWTDLFVGDLNYVFDPRASLQEFSQKNAHSRAVLVDEAHNLPERAREMFSAQIGTETLVQIETESSGARSLLNSALGRMRREILALEKVNRLTARSREVIVDSLPDSFSSCMENLILALETTLRQQQSRGNENPLLLGGYFETLAFTRALERRAEEDIVYLKRTGNRLTVKVFSVDPAARIRETLKRTNARAIFFSATLAPHDFYRRLLGAAPDDPSLLSQSPFSKRNRFVAVLDCISTRFRDREKTADRVARAVESVVATRVGHYIVFFPSFAYIDLLEKRLSFNTDDVELIRQYPRQSQEAKRAFVDAFKRTPDEAPQKSLVGLAVMGGLYGEALDLPGEQLIGAVVVGPGLPKITFERELIRAHFARKLRDGFGFAYLYPGMNKVIQAGGRVIRRERDKGVIVLIGNRFATPEYGRLLPHDWAPVPLLGSQDALRERLFGFWKSEEQTA